MGGININKLLYNHFTFGAGAAAYLREQIQGLDRYLEEFFNTRSDINRIQSAEVLAEKILKIYDFDDLIQLRDGVANLEIKRLINYERQTDHTAHTIYLFLLGIWFYDNIPGIKALIDSNINSKNPIKMFVFRWTFAALLHDIGYVFSDYELKEKNESVYLFDNMFRFDFLYKYSHISDSLGQADFKVVYEDFIKKYADSLHHEKVTAEDLIKHLNHIPWLNDMEFNTDKGTDLMKSDKIIGKELEEYSIQMAKTGYSGKPVVDHGVSGGLMLLKYTSLWYWLCTITLDKQPELSQRLTEKFNYPLDVFKKHVIPACKAVVYHNISGISFKITDEPILYLAILCDELQVWDRFLSGIEYIDNWKDIEHCMAENIEAEVAFRENDVSKLVMKVSSQQFDKISRALNKRLEGWNGIIDLEIIST